MILKKTFLNLSQLLVYLQARLGAESAMAVKGIGQSGKEL